MINLDDLTYGQIKLLKSMFGGECKTEDAHPDIGKKVIIRTYSAGVHYGKLVSKKGKECILHDAIRIYYWDGACSLSQLAMDGTKKPENCKFAKPVESITLEWIEIITTTTGARKSIEETKTWEK